MGEFVCRKCGKPATKIYLKDEHWQNECDECFGDGKVSVEVLELIKELREERTKYLIDKLGGEK